MRVATGLLVGALAFCVVGFPVSAPGQGAQNIIKQRAKDLRDQNNARQGVPPAQPAQRPQPVVQPQPGAAPAVAKGPSAQEKRLETDLAAVKAGAASEDQKKAISGSLLALAQSPKPSEAAIQRLAGELAAGLSEKPLSPSRRARLAATLGQVLNGRRVSPAQLQEYVADVQFLFQAEGLPKARAVAIGDAARALAKEIQPGS
jgi:hypothetical protein